MKMFFVLFFVVFLSVARAERDLTFFGDVFRFAVPVMGLGMSVMEPTHEGTIQLGYSVLASQLTSEILKSTVNEKRPDGADGKSFPSGHTAGAFTGAFFIHKRYGLEKAILPYILAGITGYSRVEAKKHYTHDVVAGALISGLYTWIFVDKYEKKDSQLSLNYDGSLQVRYNMKF
ncbi:MAG: phosphatase PAP2 family protein [Rickettsiales bacterium]|nr:MAG: phosphatase PAP2 family protein [Rickettsiales bacterium]